MIRAAGLAVLAFAALPAMAATTPEQKLAELVKGRTAGPPVDCIRPESIVRPEIIGNSAIVFSTPGAVYVVRPAGGCPELREGAQLRTSTLSGQICRNDQFLATMPPGPSGSGLCAFGQFVPYTKPK